ncbi:MAG: S23 ribosomal protein [Microgenomates group bacterium GW2011_GWC1_37_8]|uniref:S23 ribosomal protein n=1 Tax=Candidatus Woesebacteria bacterium GW2011_GWB1_38_8 TaxID=1618570 RepID=A0A0G0NGF2_9BACT|nr:MAG: S23 ribosomal protein [Microgenomates group bacterium GW2011_GWC1_37_8]KKQ84984.1 MAG: S23 ribosomal protein [Candidatus Woesebacteria bacterium GW2011_GWB1_38_8]
MQYGKRDSEIGYKKLIAWQISDEFAWSVYNLTDDFPKEELFGLTSQLRRAVLSIPLNIVEGYARNSKNEFRRFLKISLGSLAEVGYLLDFALRRKYISNKNFEEAIVLKERCGQLIWKLMISQK